MLTRDDVITAYRLLLRREPESEQIVDQWLSVVDSVDALTAAVIGSDEFLDRMRGRIVPQQFRLGDRLPRSPVQVRATDVQLQKLFADIQGKWQQLGETEPHWSVVTDDRYKSGALESNIGAFYATGQHDRDRLLIWLARNDIDIDGFEHCFELGCGVGRVTGYLAEIFPRVTAADISRNHLRIAEAHLGRTKRDNCTVIALESISDLARIRDYDFFYSFIVFQHNPPPVQAWMLRTILSNLKSGGIAFFQIPTYYATYSFETDRYLARGYDACVEKRVTGAIEVHPLPHRDIFRIFSETGVEVLEIREDESVGAMHAVLSNAFLVQKR